MRLSARLDKVTKALAGHTPAGLFNIIEAVPLGADEGRPPGLYKDGPEGSRVARLVFDPALGEPVVPDGVLAPHGLVIVLGPDYIEPPPDEPGACHLPREKT